MIMVDPAALGLDTELVPGVVSTDAGWTGVHAPTTSAERATALASQRRGEAILLFDVEWP